MNTTTESGTWSKADSNGYYWWRYDKNDTSRPVEVRDGLFYSVADRDATSVGFGEFLGPLSPADTEQLVRLRWAAEATLTMVNQYKERHLVPAYFVNTLAELRDVLAGTDNRTTVQCADCLAWFDKNANHTCQQQVRRNQKGHK